MRSLLALAGQAQTAHGLNPADRTEAWRDRDGLPNLEEHLAARHNELVAAAD